MYARTAKVAESNYRRFRTFPTDLYHGTWGFLIAMSPWIALSRTDHAEFGPPASVVVAAALIVARRRWARAHPVEEPGPLRPPR